CPVAQRSWRRGAPARAGCTFPELSVGDGRLEPGGAALVRSRSGGVPRLSRALAGWADLRQGVNGECHRAERPTTVQAVHGLHRDHKLCTAANPPTPRADGITSGTSPGVNGNGDARD
ncbi:MAG: hypothetical protein ACRDRQ_23950, partial [Pseudonocardiaceae bacterium]